MANQGNEINNRFRNDAVDHRLGEGTAGQSGSRRGNSKRGNRKNGHKTNRGGTTGRSSGGTEKGKTERGEGSGGGGGRIEGKTGHGGTSGGDGGSKMEKQDLAKMIDEEAENFIAKCKESKEGINLKGTIKVTRVQSEPSLNAGEGSESRSPRPTTSDAVRERIKKAERLAEEVGNLHLNDNIKFDDGKALVSWINQCKEELRSIGAINNQAVDIGRQFSRILVDFMYMFLGCNATKERFHEFKSNIHQVSTVIGPVAVRRIIAVIDFAQREIVEARGEGISFYKVENVAELKKDDLIDEFLQDLFEGIMELETIFVHESFTESKEELLSTLAKRLKRCEELLKAVEKKIREIQVKYCSAQGLIDIDRTESVIKDLWKQLVDSEEEV